MGLEVRLGKGVKGYNETQNMCVCGGGGITGCNGTQVAQWEECSGGKGFLEGGVAKIRISYVDEDVRVKQRGANF